jgi:hypothetical protein
MPVLQINDRAYPLNSGTSKVGGGSDADLQVTEDASIGVQAIIDVDPSGAVTIRRASDEAQTRVNGVNLGAEPTPLLHGDRIEVAGVQLNFADDKKGGSTQFASADEIAAMVKKRTGPTRATTATGGRLVSLVDGKEYTVPETGIVIGREAGCDVVVPVAEVSRRHAEIKPDESGYMLLDHSTNGVYANGERIQGSHRLARADVIRIGNEEFRFYADVAAPAARTSAPSATAGTPPGGTPAVAAAAAETRGADLPVAESEPRVVDQQPVTPPPPPPVLAEQRDAAPAEVVPPAATEPSLITPPIEQPTDTAAAIAAAPARRPRPVAPSPASVQKETAGIPAWAWVLVIVALVAVAAFILLS